MDIHKNARLSFRSRESLAKFVIEQGSTRKAAAAAFRVSVKTAAKWIVRFHLAGLDGLQDRSSRPHRSPRRWRDLTPPPPVQRYERETPGELLHLDIKGMTRFSEVRLRGDGRLRGKQKHPGFLALHVAIDDHSRMAFTQMLPDQKAETTIGFLHAAIQFFATHRIAIRALLTDNGSCYRSEQFRETCSRLAIKHHRTRPYTPRTNGKAERFIQTALPEWAYSQHWPDSDQRDLKLQPWTDYYNHQRPHGSLNYKPPISRSGDGTTS